MKRRHLRHAPIPVLGHLLVGACAVGCAPQSGLAATPPDPAAACARLATLTEFPVAPTQITLARFIPGDTTSADGVALPDHCQVQGIINKRVGIDGFPYGDSFEVRLPAQWNGRFMFQGGGGTEGAVPPATGSAGTLSPTLAHGWAVASQDGGHENKDLPVPNQFFLDPQAVTDHAYRSIDVTTQTAKFLIDAFYGQSPDRSYFVGCSTGGRQGMVFSQNFPDYFDGIAAGDPVYDPLGIVGRARHAAGPNHRLGHALYLASNRPQPAALPISAGNALRRSCGRRRWRRGQLCVRGAAVIRTYSCAPALRRIPARPASPQDQPRPQRQDRRHARIRWRVSPRP